MKNQTTTETAAPVGVPPLATGSVTIEQRNRIGCIFVEDGGARGDNLAIVLASYFSAHMDRPKDDPDDVDTGWGVWVIDRTNRALELIAKLSREPDTPRD